MSRRVGQVSTGQAVGMLLLVAVTVASIVLLCRWLLLPVEIVPKFDESRRLPCPPPGELAALEAPTVTSSWLFECPAAFDGQRVRYEGEAVGAVLRRDDHAWVQLNDDPYALVAGPLPVHRQVVGGNSGIAVAVPLTAADGIAHVGGPHTRGDRLEVVGRFLHADPQDGGSPVIRAEEVSITMRGRTFETPASTRRLVVAAVLAVVTLLTAVAVVRSRRRLG